VRKQITIREDQDSWIDKEAINLSKFVRQKIDEEMKRSQD